jgi:predicted metal-dependent hydrolase
LKARIERELQEFIYILECGLYRNAHEVLEDSWREIRDSVEGRFLKGLINGATALELRRLGRVEAEERVWKTFDKFMPLLDEVTFLKDPMKKARNYIVELR